MPVIGSNENVSGSRSATPASDPIPGIAPTSIPRSAPTAAAKKLPTLSAIANPSSSSETVSIAYPTTNRYR